MSKLKWREVEPYHCEADGHGDVVYRVRYEPGEFDPVHGSVWVLDIWYGEREVRRRAWIDPSLEGIKNYCEALEEKAWLKDGSHSKQNEAPHESQHSDVPRGHVLFC